MICIVLSFFCLFDYFVAYFTTYIRLLSTLIDNILSSLVSVFVWIESRLRNIIIKRMKRKAHQLLSLRKQRDSYRRFDILRRWSIGKTCTSAQNVYREIQRVTTWIFIQFIFHIDCKEWKKGNTYKELMFNRHTITFKYSLAQIHLKDRKQIKFRSE